MIVLPFAVKSLGLYGTLLINRSIELTMFLLSIYVSLIPLQGFGCWEVLLNTKLSMDKQTVS